MYLEIDRKRKHLVEIKNILIKVKCVYQYAFIYKQHGEYTTHEYAKMTNDDT